MIETKRQIVEAALNDLENNTRMGLPKCRSVEQVEQEVNGVVEKEENFEELKKRFEQNLLVYVPAVNAFTVRICTIQAVQMQIVDAPADEIGQVKEEKPFRDDQEHVRGLDRLL